jgi:small subunit ribosomal protein S8
MNIQDPISDMLTHIRNAQAVAKAEVTCPLSKTKLAVAEVLKSEGYVADCQVVEGAEKPAMTITLKYFENKPVISELKRVSRPGLRVYKTKDEIPVVKNGLGIVIVSTSQGMMSDREARRKGLGGEIICMVS